MVIASVGLNTGATAVIIGAMLVSPLMGSILASAYANVSADYALMPPLCTCGYSIANWNLRMLGGAAYLFLINAYFIFLSAALVMSLLKIPKTRELTEREWKKHRFRMIRNTLIILIPNIFALYYMVNK